MILSLAWRVTLCCLLGASNQSVEHMACLRYREQAYLSGQALQAAEVDRDAMIAQLENSQVNPSVQPKDCAGYHILVMLHRCCLFRLCTVYQAVVAD